MAVDSGCEGDADDDASATGTIMRTVMTAMMMIVTMMMMMITMLLMVRMVIQIMTINLARRMISRRRRTSYQPPGAVA